MHDDLATFPFIGEVDYKEMAEDLGVVCAETAEDEYYDGYGDQGW